MANDGATATWEDPMTSSSPAKYVWDFGGYTFEVVRGSRLDLLCVKLKAEFPKLRMRHKKTIWYHWIADFLIFIFTLGKNKDYFTYFTTTGKNCINWSDVHHQRLSGKTLEGKEVFCSPADHDRVWECLMHEREHLRQFAKRGVILMTIIWSMPPVLVCFGRALWIEKPGYIQSLRAKFVTDRLYAESEEYRDWWIGQFTGANYGWMWIFKNQVAGWFDTELRRLQRQKATASGSFEAL